MVLEESQLYRDLMRFRPEGWTANAWAVRAGVSRTVWTDMRRHGNPSRRTLEKLLTVAGSSLAEFEALRVGEASVGSDPSAGVSDRFGHWHGGALPTLPLVASTTGAFWTGDGTAIALTELNFGAIIERLPRPASLAGDAGAFAFAVVTDAMWPRFRVGRPIAVSPRAPIGVGSDVLVTLSEEGVRSGVLIAELVERSAAHLLLRQFNPDITLRLAATDYSTIRHVAGELI